jgi:PadR family transcriptional regulator, regulatory protein AphA
VIQLTQTSYVVLGLLERAGEATPYDLKQIVAATVGAFFSIPHSQLYAEPERLAGAGYLQERREQTGRRRRHYSLTAKGRSALKDWLRTPTEELYELRDPGLLKLAFGGNPQTLAKAQLSAHEERLEELRHIARTLEMAGAPQEQRLVAEAGIGHSREYIRFWKKIAAGRKAD